MTSLMTALRELSAGFLPRTIGVRRHLHRHPEPSFHEKETAAFIASELEKAGILHHTGIGGYGIKALVQGTGGPQCPGKPDAAVALRADMDALPVREESGLDFSSENDGFMHACGHDAHSAILLTATLMLHELRSSFRGTVVSLFQPAEERMPGGAQAMIREGALRNPRPRCIIGEHVNPGLEAGIAGFRQGLMMASVDDIYIRIHGKGGHGASPHLCVDPVVISAQIITALQQVTSRQANPETPTVLTFGRIHSEGATNIIPEWVDIEGTFRTTDSRWREEFCSSIAERVQGLARALGGDATLRLERGYPPVFNHPGLTDLLKEQAGAFLGTGLVQDLPLVMWAEDFAYYGMEIPACFYNLGIRNTPKGWTSPLHSPSMRVDESILETGPALMAWLALSSLDAPEGTFAPIHQNTCPATPFSVQ